jgi:hypothetical protein
MTQCQQYKCGESQHDCAMSGLLITAVIVRAHAHWSERMSCQKIAGAPGTDCFLLALECLVARGQLRSSSSGSCPPAKRGLRMTTVDEWIV